MEFCPQAFPTPAYTYIDPYHSPTLSTRRWKAPSKIDLPDIQSPVLDRKRSWKDCFKAVIPTKDTQNSALETGERDKDREYKRGRRKSPSPMSPKNRVKNFSQPRSRLTKPPTKNEPQSSRIPGAITQPGYHQEFISKNKFPPKQNVAGYPEHDYQQAVITDYAGDMTLAWSNADSSNNYLANLENAAYLRQVGARSESRSRASTLCTASSTTGTSDSASTHTSRTSISASSKRSRSDEEEDEEEDQNENRPGKKNRIEPNQLPSQVSKLFACPYSKKDPSRYSHQNLVEQDYRNCGSGFWGSIPRLKQHLYRTHDRSQDCCPRCWRKFKDEPAYNDHIRKQKKPCEPRNCPWEKMALDQCLQIKERVLGDSDKAAWFKIYEILFPDTKPPTSPYAEFVNGQDLRNLDEHYLHTIPQVLSNNLTDQLEVLGIPEDTLEDIVAQLMGSMESAIHQSRQAYINTHDIGHILAPQLPQLPVVREKDSAQQHLTSDTMLVSNNVPKRGSAVNLPVRSRPPSFDTTSQMGAIPTLAIKAMPNDPTSKAQVQTQQSHPIDTLGHNNHQALHGTVTAATAAFMNGPPTAFYHRAVTMPIGVPAESNVEVDKYSDLLEYPFPVYPNPVVATKLVQESAATAAAFMTGMVLPQTKQAKMPTNPTTATVTANILASTVNTLEYVDSALNVGTYSIETQQVYDVDVDVNVNVNGDVDVDMDITMNEFNDFSDVFNICG